MTHPDQPSPSRRRRRVPGALLQIELIAVAALVGWAVPHQTPAVTAWLGDHPAWSDESLRWLAVIVGGTLMWTWNAVARRELDGNGPDDTATDLSVLIATVGTVVGALAALAGITVLVAHAISGTWC